MVAKPPEVGMKGDLDFANVAEARLIKTKFGLHTSKTYSRLVSRAMTEIAGETG